MAHVIKPHSRSTRRLCAISTEEQSASELNQAMKEREREREYESNRVWGLKGALNINQKGSALSTAACISSNEHALRMISFIRLSGLAVMDVGAGG